MRISFPELIDYFLKQVFAVRAVVPVNPADLLHNALVRGNDLKKFLFQREVSFGRLVAKKRVKLTGGRNFLQNRAPSNRAKKRFRNGFVEYKTDSVAFQESSTIFQYSSSNHKNGSGNFKNDSGHFKNDSVAYQKRTGIVRIDSIV